MGVGNLNRGYRILGERHSRLQGGPNGVIPNPFPRCPLIEALECTAQVISRLGIGICPLYTVEQPPTKRCVQGSLDLC